MQGDMIIQLQNYDKPYIFISEVHLFNIITDLIPTAFFSTVQLVSTTSWQSFYTPDRNPFFMNCKECHLDMK